MKSTRKSIVVLAVILAVVFAVSSAALAKGYWRGGGGYCTGQRFAGPDGQGFGGPGAGAILGLDLSDSQRDQVLKIMETYQIEGIKTKGALIKERENLRRALRAETVNEQDVRQAYKRLSSLREDRLVARVKMQAEMRAILTPEQVKLLDERAAESFDRPEPRRGHGRPFAGGWSGDCPRW